MIKKKPCLKNKHGQRKNIYRGGNFSLHFPGKRALSQNFQRISIYNFFYQENISITEDKLKSKHCMFIHDFAILYNIGKITNKNYHYIGKNFKYIDN
jgi:hypothetical protein